MFDLDFDWDALAIQAKAFIDMLHDSTAGTIINIVFGLFAALLAGFLFFVISSQRGTSK